MSRFLYCILSLSIAGICLAPAQAVARQKVAPADLYLFDENVLIFCDGDPVFMTLGEMIGRGFIRLPEAFRLRSDTPSSGGMDWDTLAQLGRRLENMPGGSETPEGERPAHPVIASNLDVTTVPEPGAATTLGLGLGAWIFRSRLFGSFRKQA